MSAPRSLGVFSALIFAPSAFAGAPAAAPVTLTYVVNPDAKDGPEVQIYAQNTSDKPVNVDDNPYISAVKLYTATGKVAEIGSQPDYDMMSRAGPRRRWMAVQPGERMLVGTSHLLVPEGVTLEAGTLSFDVRVVTPDGQTTVHGAAPLNTPTS